MNNDSTALAIAPQAGMTQREGMAGTELSVSGELNTATMVAKVRAEIEARHIVALRNPRDYDTVRIKLLKECRRPGFADVARYRKPMSKKPCKTCEGKGSYSTGSVCMKCNGVGTESVTGPSIRFIEACLRLTGNNAQEVRVVHDDHERRIVQVQVIDLETNTTYSTEVVVEKTVERREAKPGVEVLGTRTNSWGDTIYIVRATEDEMLIKQNALISKAIRTNGQRIIPADLIDEAQGTAMATFYNEAATDPDAAKKKALDALAAMGVTPKDVSAYLGHDVAQCSPAETMDLRAVYTAIKDGEVSWADVLKSRTGTDDEKKDAKEASAKVEALKAKLAEKAKAKTDAKQPATSKEPGTSATGEPV